MSFQGEAKVEMEHAWHSDLAPVEVSSFGHRPLLADLAAETVRILLWVKLAHNAQVCLLVVFLTVYRHIRVKTPASNGKSKERTEHGYLRDASKTQL